MSRRQFSDKEWKEIKKTAYALKAKIDSTFLEEPNETNIAEIKALRASLEAKGFTVTVKYNFDAVNMTLDVEVMLWLPKEVN